MSRSIVEKAYAKINLTLCVTGLRADGYHEIRSVMQTVSLCDEVTLTPRKEGITLRLSDPSLPTDRRNTAYAAAQRVLEQPTCPLTGVEIYVDKRIPQQAGLAGGSADAGAVLRGLNRLCDGFLSAEALREIGTTIGADVPFCTFGGAANCAGIGEKMQPVRPLPQEKVRIVIVKPPVGVSTAAAYAAVDSVSADVARERACERRLLKALEEGDVRGVGEGLYNAFEYALAIPEVVRVRRAMETHTPLGVCMSGSGSALYALFEDDAKARSCAASLEDFGEVYLCSPTGKLL